MKYHTPLFLLRTPSLHHITFKLLSKEARTPDQKPLAPESSSPLPIGFHLHLSSMSIINRKLPSPAKNVGKKTNNSLDQTLAHLQSLECFLIVTSSADTSLHSLLMLWNSHLTTIFHFVLVCYCLALWTIL